MRRLLLWMAGNRFLRRHLPRLWFARRAVRRFMPGEETADALAAAERFRRSGTAVIFTYLGENLATLAGADAHAAHYRSLLAEIAGRDLDAEISVKPTQLGLDVDAGRTLENLRELAAVAQPRTLWLDMEGSAYTEPTLQLYQELKRSHANVGVCLQAYLKRSYADVQRLLPLEPRIRLVKGAYAESAQIAYARGREVDANFLALCVSMLEARAKGAPLFLGLGTHDVALVRQVADYAASAGLDRRAFDVEMLYGIRADQQRKLAAEGFSVRVLIAYGDYWYPWYMRRLAERPANVVFALRQLLPF
ncbi:MAG TPA: proline dehydrogenase family protein [Candidatus Limnocylindrales bacterium]